MATNGYQLKPDNGEPSQWDMTGSAIEVTTEGPGAKADLYDSSVVPSDVIASSLLVALEVEQGAGEESSVVGHADPETGLVINETLQRLVKDMERNICREIESLQAAQDYLQHQFGESAHDTDKYIDALMRGEKKLSKLTRKRPFIRTKDGEFPPPNEDQKDRLWRNEFNIYDIKRQISKAFSLREQARLTRGVGSCVLKRKLEVLYRKKERLLTLLRDACKEDCTLESEHVDVERQIAVLKSTKLETLANEVSTPGEIEKIDWMKIATTDFRGSVSDMNCRLAWTHLCNPGLNYEAWPEEEDKRLKELVATFGLHSWEEVASELGTRRTPFMCLQRWQQTINPQTSIKRPWTPDEDLALNEIVTSILDSSNSAGFIHWQTVAAHHETRSAVECMNRWKRINPLCRSGAWTETEDLQLLLSVQRHGSERWAVVAAGVPGRDATMCERRFIEVMAHMNPWSYSEDRKLYLVLNNLQNMVKRTGRSLKYSKELFRKLLPQFPGRSTISLRHRWKELKRSLSEWNQLRSVVKGNDGPPRWSAEDVRKVFLRTPFMMNLVQRLRKSGQGCPEDMAVRMLNTWKAPGPSSEGLGELNQMLSDVKDGIVIPRPVIKERDATIRWERVGRDWDFHNFMRCTEHKQALFPEVLRTLELIRSEDASSIPQSRRARLHKILANKDAFWMAYEWALRSQEIRDKIYRIRKLSALMKLVPHIAELMLKKPQHNRGERRKLGPRVISSLSASKALKMKAIGNLLKRHDARPMLPWKRMNSIYPVLRFLPDTVCNHMTQKNVIMTCRNRVRGIFESSMQISMDQRIRELSQTEGPESQVQISVPPLPPNCSTMIGFKTLLSERKKLVFEGGRLLDAFIKIKNCEDGTSKPDQKFPVDIDRLPDNQGTEEDTPTTSHNRPINRRVRFISVDDTQNAWSVLQDPHYRLLRARVLALFLWPAFLAEGSLQGYNQAAEELAPQEEVPDEASVPHELASLRAFEKSLKLQRTRKRMESFTAVDFGEDRPQLYVNRSKRKKLFLRAKKLSNPHVLKAEDDSAPESSPVRGAPESSSSSDSSESEEPAQKRRRVDTANETVTFRLGSGQRVTLPSDVVRLTSCGYSVQLFTSPAGTVALPSQD